MKHTILPLADTTVITFVMTPEYIKILYSKGGKTLETFTASDEEDVAELDEAIAGVVEDISRRTPSGS